MQRRRFFILVIRHKEKQLVLNDRTTQCCDNRFFFKSEVEITIFVLVADERIVCRVVGYRPEELVLTRLGDCVDGATCEAVIFHVKRRCLNRERLNRIIGDRRTLRRIAVGVQTKAVVERYTVNRQRVEPVVSAGNGQLFGSTRLNVHNRKRVLCRCVRDISVD